MRPSTTLPWLATLTLLAGCRSPGEVMPAPSSRAGAAVAGSTNTGSTDTGLQGTLLLIGGGLDNDNRPVYERFLELAAAHGPAHVVVATAATGPEDQEATDKSEALRTWQPGVSIEVVGRETSTADSTAAFDRATAIFFTGGDQKRITARYRPDDQATPEWQAMQRLLARGGVIAGASAGDAMMGDVMFLGGGSAAALGIQRPAAAGGVPRDAVALGPRLGPGMHFLPWAISESHFFERDRIGRLVAGLEASGQRLGIGVGEDGCVEVDLATGELRGVAVAEALLVDAKYLRREALTRQGLVARIIGQGDRVALRDGLASAPPAPLPPAPTNDVPIVEPGQNRQLASWRLFRQASVPGSGLWRLPLEGHDVLAFAAGGNVVFALRVGS